MVEQTLALSPTDHLEQKMIEDLTQMIHQYDFSSAFNEAVTEEQAQQNEWHAEYKPTVQELLKKLQDALKEEEQLESMWPDARLKDKEMFSHLNFEFDLGNKKIIGKTATKDYHGVPIYQYIYDTNETKGVEITNLDDQDTFEIDLPAPVPEKIVDRITESLVDDDVLSLEEQQEIAFKVLSFFIMLIFASIAIMYIYHRCSQSQACSIRSKKTL